MQLLDLKNRAASCSFFLSGFYENCFSPFNWTTASSTAGPIFFRKNCVAAADPTFPPNRRNQFIVWGVSLGKQDTAAKSHAQTAKSFHTSTGGTRLPISRRAAASPLCPRRVAHGNIQLLHVRPLSNSGPSSQKRTSQRRHAHGLQPRHEAPSRLQNLLLQDHRRNRYQHCAVCRS